ncbi:integrase catalytic subunit [Caballeronia arationis]|nr:integrase catalytic subunit [Caballeronia arationis]
MPDQTSYQQLQPEERLAIASLRLQDVSIRAMARILGRSPATVSRELTRNSAGNCAVSSLPACATATARVCRAPAAQTGADRFRIWSAFMCGRPQSKTDCCLVIGEGDFIKGAGNQSSVGVLVERTSRLVLLAKMEDATAASALAGFSAKLNSIAAPLRQTFTYDQGKEMSRRQELTAATGVRVYFCDPHSPWQRGTCENTNGLLRQYLPNIDSPSRLP